MREVINITINIPDIVLFYICFLLAGKIINMYKDYWEWRIKKRKDKLK